MENSAAAPVTDGVNVNVRSQRRRKIDSTLHQTIVFADADVLLKFAGGNEDFHIDFLSANERSISSNSLT